MTLGDITFQNPEVLRLFDQAPAVTFFHIRDAIGGMFGSHRREWLSRKDVDFHGRGMQAANLTSAPAPGGPRSFSTFFYRVQPTEKKATPASKLSDIKAEAYTESDAALGLEKGGAFRPTRGRLIAIPIGVTLDSTGRPKSRWVTPARYRRTAGNDLVAIENRKGTVVLYQVKGSRSKKAAESKGAFTETTTGRRRILLPAYVLVPRVQRKPRLKFMSTWEALASDRGSRMKRAANKIIQEIARAKRS